MARRPTRWPKREAYPVSVFRWNAHWLRSFLRNTQRKKFMPHTWSRAWGNRSCENGIRISTTQPNESTDVATSHTGSVNPAGVKQDDICSNDFFIGDRSWDPVWDDPAQRIDRRRDVPHGVPRPIPDEEVVAANVALLHPGGIYGELKRRAVVVVAVKVHVKHVALRIVVTAAETARNLGGLGVVQPRAPGDRGVVVHGHHRRRFDGRRALPGNGPCGTADAPGLLPRGVVEPAVEHGWALDPDSRHDGRRTSARMTQSGGIGGYLYVECGRDHQHRRQPP